LFKSIEESQSTSRFC